MASRTLLQLFALSIIFTKQTETRTLNATSNFANQTYSVDITLVDKQFNKTNESDRTGTEPMKDIHAQQRVYTSPESKHGIEFSRYINEENDADNLKTEQPSNNGLQSNTTLSPNVLTSLDNSNHYSNKQKYTEKDGRMNSINNDFLEALAIRTAIEKVKQELNEIKDKWNDESLHNAAKEHLTHTKLVSRLKYSTRHQNTYTRTTQSITESSLITDADNGIRKIEHGEKINHKTSDKLENNIYEIQRPNEFKITSKHDNKLKYIDNKSRDALSLENEQYELKHVDDMVKTWALKQINLEHTPKNKLKKKHSTDKPIQRFKYLTAKYNTNTRTIQSMTENTIAEVNNVISKMGNTNHKTPDTREHDIYELQRPSEFKIASKHDYELKYINNTSRDALSLENEQYELKQVHDMAKTWALKLNNLEDPPKHKQNKKHVTDKSMQRLKYLIARHNTNTRTTPLMTKNSFKTEVDNGKYKIEHGKNRHHNTTKTPKNDIYKLQRLGEFKIASKDDNELKYSNNKSRDALSLENEQYELKHVDDMAKTWALKQINLEYPPKHKQKKIHLTDKSMQRRKYFIAGHNTNTRTTQLMSENSLIATVNNVVSNNERRGNFNTIHKTKKKRENDIYKLQRPSEFKIASKYDNKLKYIHDNHGALSLGKEQYELKHVDDTADVWVSKEINLENTSKYKRKVQKRKHHDDIVTKDKNSHTRKKKPKIKLDLETYQDKYKLAVKRKDEGETILDSGHTLNPDEVATQTLQKHDDVSHKPLKRKNKGSKLKKRHNKKSSTKSLENEIYTYEVKVPKQVPKLNKPKFSQNYQNKKYDKIANTNKHIDKPKNKSDKVISNLYKQNDKNILYFITEKHTNIKRKDERILNSRDKIEVDEEDIRKIPKQAGRQADRQIDEEASLDSCEEPFKQNKTFHLPFYISTTTHATNNKELKHTKNKRETKTLLHDLNTVLNEKKNLNNDALNQTINKFVSSKIFDLITDRVAGKILKKLQKLREERNLMSKHQFKAETEVTPNKVEKVDILFKKNGDMQVMVSRENLTEIETNKRSDIDTFYSFYF